MDKNKFKKLSEIFSKEVEPILESTMRLSQDSVDSQIDSILLRYQNDASIEEDLGESKMPEHFRSILEGTSKAMSETMSMPISEAPEDEEGAPEDDMSVGDEQLKADRPADPREQKIDIDQFAQKVANLAENWENLLEVKAAIVNRAKNLLAQGYAPDLVQEFMDLLDREFGITPDYREEELPSAPPGGNAGPIS
jgi:hypothetical protein